MVHALQPTKLKLGGLAGGQLPIINYARVGNVMAFVISSAIGRMDWSRKRRDMMPLITPTTLSLRFARLVLRFRAHAIYVRVDGSRKQQQKSVECMRRRRVRHRGFSCFCMRMVVMSCLLASYLGSDPAQASFVLAMRSRRSGLSDWALISLAMHRHLELGCNKYSMFHDPAMKGMAPILANVLS